MHTRNAAGRGGAGGGGCRLCALREVRAPAVVAPLQRARLLQVLSASRAAQQPAGAAVRLERGKPQGLPQALPSALFLLALHHEASRLLSPLVLSRQLVAERRSQARLLPKALLSDCRPRRGGGGSNGSRGRLRAENAMAETRLRTENTAQVSEGEHTACACPPQLSCPLAQAVLHMAREPVVRLWRNAMPNGLAQCSLRRSAGRGAGDQRSGRQTTGSSFFFARDGSRRLWLWGWRAAHTSLPWAPFEPGMRRAEAERLGGTDELQRCGKTRLHAHNMGACCPRAGLQACPFEKSPEISSQFENPSTQNMEYARICRNFSGLCPRFCESREFGILESLGTHWYW